LYVYPMTFDHWISLIELSSTLVMAAAAFLQAVLLFLTFRFGTKYLAQHRKKYLLENKLKLIELTIKSIRDLLAVYDHLFSISYDHQMKLKADNDYGTFKEVLAEFWRKFENTSPQRKIFHNEISSNLSLIDDGELHRLHKKCRDAYMMLIARFLHLRDLNCLEDQPYGQELFKVLPFSIYQKSRGDTVEFMVSYDSLNKELKSFYFKDLS